MIPGTIYIQHFVPHHFMLFDELKRDINWREDMKSRKTASCGKPYNYSGIAYPETPIPDSLLPFLKKTAEITGFLPNNILINYYHEAESKMGFHSDDTSILEENTGVVILSLGSSRTMRFKEKNTGNLLDLELLPGSLLYMKDENQRTYLHAILPSTALVAERISVTFRRMK